MSRDDRDPSPGPDVEPVRAALLDRGLPVARAAAELGRPVEFVREAAGLLFGHRLWPDIDNRPGPVVWLELLAADGLGVDGIAEAFGVDRDQAEHLLGVWRFDANLTAYSRLCDAEWLRTQAASYSPTQVANMLDVEVATARRHLLRANAPIRFDADFDPGWPPLLRDVDWLVTAYVTFCRSLGEIAQQAGSDREMAMAALRWVGVERREGLSVRYNEDVRELVSDADRLAVRARDYADLDGLAADLGLSRETLNGWLAEHGLIDADGVRHADTIGLSTGG